MLGVLKKLGGLKGVTAVFISDWGKYSEAVTRSKVASEMLAENGFQLYKLLSRLRMFRINQQSFIHIQTKDTVGIDVSPD